MAQPGAHEAQQTVAVVVAHGIGNQLPMDTVRALVDNVFGSRSGPGNAAPVYSRLDRDADFLDLRRLSLTKTDDRPRVDFYELYWQPTFGTGSPGAVLGWVFRLLRRRPLGDQMRRVVLTVRTALGLLLLLVVGAALLLMVFGPDEGWKQYAAPALPLVAVAAALPKLLVRNLLANVAADASRWFSPGPGDVESRDKVRLLGLNLLKELHRPGDDGRPRYGRIIVVAHSLGAAVTYDAIRLAFDELRDPAPLALPPTGPPDRRQPHAWRFATAVPGEPPVLGDRGAPLIEEPAGQTYHRVQSELHAEQRAMGVSWRVTDFITVGSPLTHAQDLLTRGDVSLERRMDENELPTCPPRGEQQHREIRWAGKRRPVQLAAGKKGTGRVAFYRQQESGPLRVHEASPFATTRWTNLYIPMRWWLGGDPVGGPAAPVFGRGVVDVPVDPSAPRAVRRRVLALPVGAHTWYWRRVGAGSDDPEKDCIEQLRSAMGSRWS